MILWKWVLNVMGFYPIGCVTSPTQMFYYCRYDINCLKIIVVFLLYLQIVFTMANQNPEQIARDHIDRQLIACG
jgi:hypothetical protein